MKVVDFKSVGSVIAQLRDGETYKAIEHEGTIYVPLASISGIVSEKTTSEKPGKGAPASIDEDAEETPAPAPKGRGKKAEKEETPAASDSKPAVLKALQALDSGKANATKTVEAIMEAMPDANKADVKTAVNKFADDPDLDIDEVADEIVALGGDAPEEKPAGRGRGAKPAAKKTEKEAYTAIEDLQVGDEVSVWWGTDPENDETYDEWFEGEVSKIQRGKVFVKYEDGSEEALIAEFNTKIKVK